MKLDIEIEINEIKVEDRHFNFEYLIKIDGKVKIKDNYENDYSGYDNKLDFEKVLKNGWAYQCILDEYEIKDLI